MNRPKPFIPTSPHVINLLKSKNCITFKDTVVSYVAPDGRTYQMDEVDYWYMLRGQYVDPKDMK